MPTIKKVISNELDNQLEEYFSNLNKHLKIENKATAKDKGRIETFITRTNNMANIITSEEHSGLLAMEREQIGPVFIRVIKCVDGRDENAADGQNIKVWRVPASLLQVRKRTDGSIVPEAYQLAQGIRATASNKKNELLQIIRPHMSTHTNHGCGAMRIKKDSGEITDEDLAMGNIKLIKKITAPAINNIYNDERDRNDLPRTEEVTATAFLDTDDMGIILNYEGRAKGESLESSKLVLEFKDKIAEVVGEKAQYADMNVSYLEQENYHEFTRRIFFIVEDIFNEPRLRSLRKRITSFISDKYSKLSPKQQHALAYYFVRRMAVQHLTGWPSEAENPIHAHAVHNEVAAVVSRFSKYPGQFDQSIQTFTISPDNLRVITDYIKVVLGIMDKTKPNEKQIVYLAHPLKESEVKERLEPYRYAAGFNTQLFTTIIDDPELGKRFRSGKLILISLLIDNDSRKVHKILDPSIYI